MTDELGKPSKISLLVNPLPTIFERRPPAVPPPRRLPSLPAAHPPQLNPAATPFLQKKIPLRNTENFRENDPYSFQNNTNSKTNYTTRFPIQFSLDRLQKVLNSRKKFHSEKTKKIWLQDPTASKIVRIPKQITPLNSPCDSLQLTLLKF